MNKITYYLGAGASFHSIPILNNQAQMMIKLAQYELQEQNRFGEKKFPFKFIEEERDSLPNSNKIKILWHIGFFGKKALTFNTIDTYARKLELIGDITQLDLLKMSISVFFDLWENFYKSRYLFSRKKDDLDFFEVLDPRYIALFSILLEKGSEKIYLNDNIKFISWNYDLQLESTFRLFQGDKISNFDELNECFFRFKNNELIENDVYHLNGHRGFHSKFSFVDLKKYNEESGSPNSIDSYWKSIDGLFDSVLRQTSKFSQNINYAWEHEKNTESTWFKNISKVLAETNILVVIGYSFPPFNRKIDQLLFNKLNKNKIKKIVYQDPNANKELIENLFINPVQFENKIEIEKSNLEQFYLPNEHFIRQITKTQSQIR